MEKDVERGIKHRVREGGERGRQRGSGGRMVRQDEGKGEVKHNALQCVSRTVYHKCHGVSSFLTCAVLGNCYSSHYNPSALLTKTGGQRDCRA